MCSYSSCKDCSTAGCTGKSIVVVKAGMRIAGTAATAGAFGKMVVDIEIAAGRMAFDTMISGSCCRITEVADKN